VPSLLIPICFYGLVDFAGPCPPLWVGSGFQLVSNFVQPFCRYFRWLWLCLFLFYFNGEFDPGSG
jgi:hypothetical protein